jgi:uncharacterized protein (UPF0332 family)
MTPEQQSFLDKATRSLAAAKNLQSAGFPDFAASRAYYAMFYVATAFLEGEGLTYAKHSAVIAKFGELFARPGRVPTQYHRYLLDAERTRLKADYDTALSISEAEAEQIIVKGEEILNFALANIDSIPPLSP